MRKLIKKALAPLVRELVQEQLKEIEAQNKIDPEQFLMRLMGKAMQNLQSEIGPKGQIGRFYNAVKTKQENEEALLGKI